MLIFQRRIHLLPISRIVLCVLLTSVSIASNLNAQNQVGRTKIGAMSPRTIAPGAQPEADEHDCDIYPAQDCSVFPKKKTLVGTYVEYATPPACRLISSGSWEVRRAPRYGKAEQDGTVTGHLANGDCPDTEFPFAALYYTWTLENPGDYYTDSFAATWRSGTDFPPVSETFPITLIRPINFQQLSSYSSNGVLHFRYTWQSTSRNLKDLDQCMVGEYVTYPAPLETSYNWPSPPYKPYSNPNPLIAWSPATKVPSPDVHRYGNGFMMPYRFDTFTSVQQYRYQCTNLGAPADFEGWTHIPIDRTVSEPVKNCWQYTVTKNGYSASLSPLPGANPKSCPSEVSSSVPLREPGFTNSGDQVGLSVTPPDASVASNAPIFFNLTVSNRSAEAVEVDLGLNGKENLELAIREPGGRVISRTLSSEGFGSTGEVSLDPGGAFVERLLLNEWYEFPVTGTYRIKITLLDDAFAADETANADRPSTEFSVQIDPREPVQLERVSEELADKAIGAATLEERMDAANALSYIRDPLAVDSLIRVLQEGTMVEHYAIDGLGRIGSPEAIAALEGAQYHSDEDVRTAARYALAVLRVRTQGASEPENSR